MAVKTYTREELIKAVKEHASANYEKGGWDVIVECWDDGQIDEHIGRARTPNGAIAKFGGAVSVWADQQAEARQHAHVEYADDFYI